MAVRSQVWVAVAHTSGLGHGAVAHGLPAGGVGA
jgi:hypothetical protein